MRGTAVVSVCAWVWIAIGCDCSTPPRACSSNGDCASNERCVDGTCQPIPDGGSRDDGGDDGGMMCTDGRASCGPAALCCPADQVCMAGACSVDCAGTPACGGACCGAGQECLSDRCVVECADEANRCGAMDELCCATDQACLGDACVPLGAACTLTEECELDELCEPALMRCVPRTAVEVCEYRPPVGTFSPTIGCRWVPPAGARASSDDVVMAPAVGNLTDDNGDGLTNTLDIPDVVLVSFDRPTDGCCTARGTLRVIDGRCQPDGTMTTIATIDTPFIDNSTGVAIGNLHPDTMPAEAAPEIVATIQNNGTVAFRRTADDGSAWEVMWQNTMYLRNGRYNGSGAAPSLADVNGDGQPEVVVGNVVLNGLDGSVMWDGAMTVRAGAGVGNNAFLGPTSTIADLDLDGDMEVIAGNTVYDGATGAEVWTYTYTTSNSSCGGSVACDGYNAIGNFDDDPQAEIVIVRRGEVFVLEHDGTLKRQIQIPTVSCANNEGGPPTVADFDGDLRAEIGVATADYYIVFDLDCTGSVLPAECAGDGIRWQVRNHDCSSRSTGSSVFDFDGDGRAEVVYADEQNFRIFDGTDGTILFDDPTHRSNTRLEMPIVVDVDNDGKSEVLVPEAPGNAVPSGLVVWTDAGNNWVRTRRIWNQHSYHVTNVSEDGQIPRVEPANWSMSRLNNFRQNVQPGGLFDAPDLIVESIELDACMPATATAEIAVTVANRGALAVAPGVPVIAFATPMGGAPEPLGVMRTTTTLLPGGRERLIFTWMPAGGFTTMTFSVRAVVDDDGMGGSEYNECHEDNNEGMAEALMTCMFG
ncbi:MAG: FG-GAP repeat domain-containing protein [Sandaracinaceae bacterium]